MQAVKAHAIAGANNIERLSVVLSNILAIIRLNAFSGKPRRRCAATPWLVQMRAVSASSVEARV